MNNFTVYQRGHTARIYRFPTFDSEDFGADYGPSYVVQDTRPNLVDCLAAENLQRAAEHYPREARKARVWAWFNRIIGSDAFFLVTGALVAADCCLLIYLAGGGR